MRQTSTNQDVRAPMVVERRSSLPMTRDPAHSWRLAGWLVEAGPLIATLTFLWGKLVYLSLFVPSEWWANEPSIGHWMRPTLDVFAAAQTHPHIASATLASLLLLLAPTMLLTPAWRFIALLGLNLALTVLGLIDLLHVRFYADVLSASSFTTTKMVRDVLPSLGPIVKATDPMYVADILIALLVLPIYLGLRRRAPPLASRSRGHVAVGMLVGGLVLATPTIRLAWAEEGGLFTYTSLRVEVASVTGLLPYHLLEAVDSLRSRRDIGDPEVARIHQFLAQERERKGSPSELFGAARGLNVILVSAESLQAFPIGLEVRGQPVAPRLTAFVRESLYFENFHDQTYLGTTSDAQFASLQSLHPQPVGFVVMKYPDNDYRALPAIVADHGYTTLAAVAAPNDFWNADRLHPRYGFQHSYHEDDFVIGERIGPWMADRDFFAQVTEILARQPQPFFADILSSSNHHPYYLPHGYQVLDLGDLEGTLLGRYLHSVHYFDRAFGEWVDRLREVGLLDRTMIVVYGDHQGFLGDPPELAELLGLPEWNEYARFKVRKRVPFFIRLPGGAAAGSRDIAGGHLDIAPTILSLLGLADDSGVMLGRDLTRQRESVVAFRDGSFSDGRHYSVNRFGSTFGLSCYEMDTGRAVDCGLLEAQRREARERLEVSDLILQGNLIAVLRDRSPALVQR